MKITSFVLYETATGRVVSSGSTSGSIDGKSQNPLLSVLETTSPIIPGDRYYVVGGSIQPRPEISPESVPPGTKLYLDDEFVGTIDDGVLEADVPGVYRVRMVPPFPYREYVNEALVVD